MTMTIVRRAQPWLGTLVSIEVVASAGLDLEAAFSHGFDAIARVHRAMSPQHADSDVARFNRVAGGATIRCDPWTLGVLRLAARVRHATDGLFDVALGTAQGGAYRSAGVRRVEKIAGTARIDLGGIAKGYAVDRAVQALRARGVTRGLINAGGDLRAFGAGSWPVIVRGVDGRPAMRLALEGGAVATSVYRAGRSPFRNDPLIAPENGRVHAIDQAITVAAPSCALADALTKVVALSGDTAHPLISRLGGRAWLH